MSLERWLFGSVIYPAYHFCKGDTVNARIAEYEKSQWRSADELQAIQATKLRDLIRHAARLGAVLSADCG